MATKRIAIIAILVLLVAGGVAWWRVYAPGQAARCAVCTRTIHAGMTTGYTVAGEAEQKEACCAACVLAYGRQSGRAVTVQHVTDFASAGRLTPERAIFVVGSDEHPCSRQQVLMTEPGTPVHVHYDRCEPSIIAFGDAERARAFAREHGGNVETWSQVLAGLSAPVPGGEKKP